MGIFRWMESHFQYFGGQKIQVCRDCVKSNECGSSFQDVQVKRLYNVDA